MELFDWDVAAGGNGFAAPDGFPEGMNYSQVNNAAREIMAVVARWYSDISGESLSAGTGSAYTLTSNRTLSGYVDGLTYRFRAHATNGAGPTINISAQGAVPITNADGSALTAGEMKIGGVYEITYSSTLAGFSLNGGVAKSTDVIRGIVELSTDAEAEAETSTDHAITPNNLAGIGVWKDSRYYESAEQTYTHGSLITLAHGLSAKPKFVQVAVVCKTTEWGYAVGEEVIMSTGILSGTSTYASLMVSADATNIKLRIDTEGIYLVDASNFNTIRALTPANWKLVARAYA